VTPFTPGVAPFTPGVTPFTPGVAPFTPGVTPLTPDAKRRMAGVTRPIGPAKRGTQRLVRFRAV
jgi:hypothetical protein